MTADKVYMNAVDYHRAYITIQYDTKLDFLCTVSVSLISRTEP